MHPINDTKKEIKKIKEFENKKFPLSLESDRRLTFINAKRKH